MKKKQRTKDETTDKKGSIEVVSVGVFRGFLLIDNGRVIGRYGFGKAQLTDLRNYIDLLLEELEAWGLGDVQLEEHE